MGNNFVKDAAGATGAGWCNQCSDSYLAADRDDFRSMNVHSSGLAELDEEIELSRSEHRVRLPSREKGLAVPVPRDSGGGGKSAMRSPKKAASPQRRDSSPLALSEVPASPKTVMFSVPEASGTPPHLVLEALARSDTASKQAGEVEEDCFEIEDPGLMAQLGSAQLGSSWGPLWKGAAGGESPAPPAKGEADWTANRSSVQLAKERKLVTKARTRDS
ncbi:hypothetical protein T484DRAFT_1892686 [Baffinella frigidus]|nr:hypothetical protein T484DRAFT_1892686 [Cryptophyta sp. CCMP2293]